MIGFKRGKKIGNEKILFAIYQTNRKANGGAESITKIIERLGGYKKIVVTETVTNKNRRWNEAGSKVIFWKILSFKYSLVKRLINVAYNNIKINKIIKQEKIRIVHCNDIQSLPHVLIGAKLNKVKLVFNIRDIKPTSEKYGKKWRILISFCDHILLLSNEMKETLIERNVLLERRNDLNVSFIYSAVEFSNPQSFVQRIREKLRKEHGIAKNEIVIGYVAVVCPKKNQLEFIEKAGKIINSKIPNVKIYFVGDFDPEVDPYSLACLNKVKELDLMETFQFIGHVEHIEEWYTLMDICLLASKYEGLARAMIESLCCGTPVISFDVCSAKEILDKYDCGFVVSQGNYAGVIDRLYEMSRNESLRKNKSANALKVSNKLFNPDNIAKEYENLYDSLLGH